MKKIYSFFVAMAMVFAVNAQKTTLTVNSVAEPFEIDATIEAAWDAFEQVNMERPYSGNNPTVTAWFKLAYDTDNFYMVLHVEDDDHYPAWETAASANWEFDKPEVYFDVNAVLNDAKGAMANAGHYQWAPQFLEAGYGVTLENSEGPGTTATPTGITWCYDHMDEGYIVEYAFAWERFTNGDGVVMDVEAIKALPDGCGFDVCVIDKDEATLTRDRLVWQHDGVTNGTGEGWDNMDGCGAFKLVASGKDGLKTLSMNVYPNPAVNQLTVNASFNKVVISNIAGQQVKAIESSSKVINVADLKKGVYFVNAYKNGKQVGAAKFTKN